MGLHFIGQNKTYSGKKTDGVTISSPIVFDIQGNNLYSFKESFAFTDPVFYNKDSSTEDHNKEVADLMYELTDKSNPVIICYTLNEDYLNPVNR